MRVELLYFDGCPHWEVADGRLREALRSLGRDGTAVERVKVESAEQAQTLNFVGSPTIRIDGVDPFASGGEPVGLACRLYATPDGVAGSPTVEQLIQALT